MNHHAGFFQVKEEAKHLVDPEFFSLFFEKQLQEVSISEGSKTLTLDMIKSLDFDIPPYDVQKKTMLEIRPLLKAKEKIGDLFSRIDSIRERILSVEYRDYQVKNIPISKILNCYGGNTGLTEEEIYQRILVEGQRYEVLSASTSEETKLGTTPKFQLNGKELEVLEDKEGILVIRKGKAGITYYREKGKYTLTDDAYFLTVKENCGYDINLKWLIAQYRQAFFDYSSSSDNGTWNMTGFFEEVTIAIPSYEEQLELVEKYERLELLQANLQSILAKIDQLFTNQIVI